MSETTAVSTPPAWMDGLALKYALEIEQLTNLGAFQDFRRVAKIQCKIVELIMQAAAKEL